MENEVLRAIRERRSIHRFRKEPIPREALAAVLEAGRWAPSYANLQPWEFIVVEDEATKEALGEIIQKVTIYRRGVTNAMAVIVVVADPEIDPLHYREDAAAAAQNMALAAHSLGLATYWIGIPEGGPGSAEALTKELLAIPDELSVVAILPLGYPDPDYTPQKDRRPLEETVFADRYGTPLFA